MPQNRNIEIKARHSKHDSIREFLKNQGADFKGIDHQIDTYFSVKNGRLKIREGTIENCIVNYSRKNTSGPKLCEYSIICFEPEDHVLSALKDILTTSLEVITVVDKKREIYFLDNIKFHLDTVKELGKYVEIEAIETGNIGEAGLRKQCDYYLTKLGIEKEELVKVSYSDMMIEGIKHKDEG